MNAPDIETSPKPATSPSSVHEPVHFYSDGLRLSGQFTRASGATGLTRSPTVLCIHGYTGRKEVYMPGYVRELSAAGFNTLDFHHRGFGESEGIPLRNKPWDQVEDIMNMRYEVVDKECTPLQNIIDEILALYHSTLYKLKFLA